MASKLKLPPKEISRDPVLFVGWIQWRIVALREEMRELRRLQRPALREVKRIYSGEV